MDDWQLLNDYATRNSEEAFQALVERYAGMVYHTALRQVQNPHSAEEVAQVVFIILARKAAKIRPQPTLYGWLFRATRFAVLNQRRQETNRARHEQEAYAMQSASSPDDLNPVWEQITPNLDDALDNLPATDRELVMIRYFGNKSHKEAARMLGVSEDVVRKRLSRAMEKLRVIFARRGVAVSSLALAAAFTAHGVQAAPVGLASSLAGVAVAKGATASGSTLTLIKGALKIMAWTKMKTALVAAGGCVLLAGGVSTTLFVATHRASADFGYDRTYVANPAAFPRETARIARWRQDPWPAERQREEARIKSRQANNETVNATMIDLKPYLNTALTASPASPIGNMEDNMAELPSGTNVFAGVPFDVKGSIQLNGAVMFSLFKKNYPNQVGPIPINRTCAKIHLLHGCNAILSRDFGRSVARLVLHYSDGNTHEISLVGGKHLFDWWAPLFTTGVDPRFLQPAPGTERAWTGGNPYIRANQPDESLVLYKSTFENPRPDVPLASLDYVSTMTEAAPFLVGLTVE